MRILLSGARGMIGSALAAHLTAQGHEVRRLVRATMPAGTDIRWDPAAGAIDRARLEGMEAVVHLSGAPIAVRWNAATKARLRASRIESTRVLAEAVSRLDTPPRVMIAASATGYYGDRGAEVLTEDSAAGTGFLAELCRDWEAATAPAAARGLRVVNARFGVVLSPSGGMLPRLLPLFRLGGGGVLGSGRQYLSWVAIDDLLRAVDFLIANEALRGPVNVVAPTPVTNADFTHTLARVLARPAPFAVPAFALRLVFGEMAQATLLASARVHPAKLLAAGFSFQYPDLDGALRHLLLKGGGTGGVERRAPS